MNQNASRRQFLRGLGTCIALPPLASIAPKANAAAAGMATTATGAPLRAAYLFFPNGSIPDAWWPSEPGKDYQISSSLKPLEPLKDRFQIMKGLDNVSANPGADGGGDHARGNATFLTSVRLNKSSTDIRAGVSIDQLIASQVGGVTRFPSLELASDPRRQATGCDSGYSCAYQYNISWKSETTPMATEHNPRMVFERLFGVGEPGERVANLQRRRVEQRSILDFVLDDAKSMQRRAARNDARKLDEFLSGIRALESQIQRAEQLGDPSDPGIPTPAGVPQSHEEYVDVMFELIALAFETDSTRVVSLMLGHDGDNRSYDFLGIPEGHHDLSHHQNNPDRITKIAQIDTWYAQQFAKLIGRLDRAQDADGNSVLHNSMVLIGSGNADGNRHTHVDLPVILAGNGGGHFNPGRFVDHQHKPIANLYLQMAGLMGVEGIGSFGDSDGVITNL